MATAIVSVHDTRFFTLLALEIRRMVVSVAECGAKIGIKIHLGQEKTESFHFGENKNDGLDGIDRLKSKILLRRHLCFHLECP